jgi:membrane protein
MLDVSPESPEERGRRETPARAFARQRLERLRPGVHSWAVVKRVGIGVYADGFIHAGNLAYLTLLTLFPFFIVTAALARIFGRSEDSRLAVSSFLETVPPSVANLLAKPIDDVLTARTGSLLWLGAIVGLWSVGSFIETIRDILRRAYGTKASRAFYHYRLGAAFMTIASVILVLMAFSAQVALTAVEQFIYRILPFASEFGAWVGISRLAPAVVMFGALYALFYTLTPMKYRTAAQSPKWPGPAFITAWWSLITVAMPWVLSQLGNYDLTYGSLAGVIITLLFFYLLGFGVVVAAHLNAALAESPGAALKGTPTQG